MSILDALPVAIAEHERALAADSLARWGPPIEPHERTEAAYWQAWVAGMTADHLDERQFHVFTLPNPFRGYLALGAYQARVAPPTLRRIVADVWDHDHHHLLRAVKGRRATVRAMMRRAEFDVSGLPETFTIYRGVHGVAPGKARLGLSWTTSYEVAAWFARPSYRSHALVIRANARRSDAVFHHHERYEHEVVLARAPTARECTVADGREEWLRREAAQVRDKEARKAAWLADAA